MTTLVVASAAYGFIRYSRAKDKPEFTFDAATVDRGAIVAKVTATGTLSAIVTVQVGSQVSGRIAALYADFNSPVKKGELIAKIDPQIFEATVAQARANDVAAEGNLAKAKAQALDAERQYTRSKELAARKLIAQADLDTAQANYDAAKAQVDASAGSVEQAKAALHQAQVNLAYTDIVSPTDGVVISRNVDVGQTVAASLQAPTLFLIAEDLRKMQVDTSVAEADVGRLTQGMKATFTVDAYPNDKFVGVVRQIRNAPQTVQNVVTYDAVIDVANPELKLKPGMTANCTFVYAQREDVLRIPNAALRFRPSAALLAYANGAENGPGRGPNTITAAHRGGSPGGAAELRGQTRADDPDRRTVWVLRGTQPVPVQVETGVTDGTVTELVSGDVHDGDNLIADIISGPGSGRSGGAPLRRMF
ncbi:MAG: efflux RND transporter periplasmic adaptor subunit [Acidobacteriota bacterium]